MREAKITYARDGHALVFEGDAVQVFQVAALMTGIKLLAHGIKPNRAWTMRRALDRAGHYTGKTYKRTQWQEAIQDLGTWKEAMRLAVAEEVQK